MIEESNSTLLRLSASVGNPLKTHIPTPLGTYLRVYKTFEVMDRVPSKVFEHMYARGR
jgi:hypothetical protein